MCRSIQRLRGEQIASDEEIHAAALQFVRKISGYRQPSKSNTEAFERAVEGIGSASKRLLEELPPITASARSTREPALAEPAE